MKHLRMALVCGCAPLVMAWASGAFAQAAHTIEIPAQPISTALETLSQQSGVNILFTPDLVGTSQAPAVHGAHTVDEAAQTILAGSGLEVVHDSGGSLLVRRRLAASATVERTSLVQPAAQASIPTPVPTPAAPPKADDATVEVVVTAMKSGTATAQKTPAAVTVLSSDTLTKAGVTTISSLTSVTPGLQVAPVRTTALTFIRGVGSTLTSPNADPAIAININGAYVPMEMTAAGFFDLDRVEVLPGPQGTLYGHNSTGGVINLITKRPGQEYSTDGFVEIGNYGRIQTQIGVNTPITDTLALRTALTWIRHDGYDSNGGDDQDTKAARETAVWKPDSKTTIVGIATYSQDGGVGGFNFNIPANSGPYRHLNFDPRALGLYVDYRTFTGSLEIDRQLTDNLQLTYIGGYDHLEQSTKTAAYNSTPLAILTAAQSNNTNTQELRLSGTFDKFKVLGGLYWFDATSGYATVIDNEATPVTTLAGTGPLTAKGKGWAGFTQGTYSFTPKIRLTGGLRYSSTDKSVDGQNSTTTINNTTNVTKVTVVPYAGSETYTHVDWRVALEADIFEHSMVYGTVSTGFTPGGLSTAPAVLGQLPAVSFKPVFLTAYAAGLKNRFFDNKLTFNVEGFYYDYRNYQVSQKNLVTGQNNVYTADKAQVYGAQIDGRFSPTHDDDINFGVSLQKARALILITPAGNFDHFQLPFAPDATVNLSYKHNVDLQGGGRLEGFLNSNWISSRWGTYTHSNGTFVKPTGNIDATLTYWPPSAKYSLSLWGRNLTNAIIPTQVSSAPAPAGPGQEFLMPPRTFGIRIGFNY